jgi:hypothetical protein
MPREESVNFVASEFLERVSGHASKYTQRLGARLTIVALAAARPRVRADRAARRLPHLPPQASASGVTPIPLALYEPPEAAGAANGPPTSYWQQLGVNARAMSVI